MEFGAVPEQRSLASRAARPLAVALGVAATFGVGFVAGQPKGLSMASLRSITGLETAELDQYKTMQADSFVKYSGYTGGLVASGVVTMHNAETPDEDFNWILSMSGDTGCSSSQSGYAANACGMVITTGTDCGTTTGNPYYAGTTDPYGALTYETTSAMGQGAAIGSKKNVQTGYTGTQLNGKTLIIFDSLGDRAACAVIAKSVLSDLPGGACFPGDSSVNVEGRGAVPLSELEIGDPVLVQRSSGELMFEPLLGFLHSTKGPSRFISIQHAGGELRASANHLIFVADGTSKIASQISVGDEVLAVADGSSEKPTPSTVLSVSVVSGEAGMIAPLTMTGSIIVDSTVASAYPTHSTSVSIPHGVIHALFFPVRLLARASFGTWGTGPSPNSDAVEATHPLVNFYAQLLTPFAKNVLKL
eukprot:TRINITY_DN2714_c0_g3_i1.p1 TRINITY_DN2714_c0_g3~~TRINITY_DN2714_c0_g3_i1.p1  ORF type:complete len:457 (+),score=77.10 TRINITY_DN2714_c0_g3_i1:120-1373(+)